MIKLIKYPTLLYLFLLGDVYGVWAQAAPLPLQPHKLREVRRLYREGVARHDTLKIAESYYRYAKLTMAAGDLIAAKQWFLKSMRIIETRGDTYELARLYVRLGDLAMIQLNYSESLRNAHKALSIAQRSRSNKALIRSYSLLSRFHGRNWATIKTKRGKTVAPLWPTGNSDSSLYYLRKVEYLAYRLNDSMEVAHVTQDIGHSLLSRHDPLAIEYLVKAMYIADKQKSSDRTGMTMSVAQAYLTFKQPVKARPYIQRVIELYKEQSPTVSQQHNLEDLQIAYHKATGNWREASRHIEAKHKLRINELIADRQGAVSRLSIEYETEKKEALLNAQQTELTLRADNLRNHQFFLAALTILLLGAAIASVVFYRLNQANKRISSQNALLVREQNHRTKNNLQLLSDLLDRPLAGVADPNVRQAVEESQSRIAMMGLLQRRLYDGDSLATVELAEFIEEVVLDTLSAFGCDHVQTDFALTTRLVSADTALYVGLIVNELITNACKHAFQDHPAPQLTVSCQPQHPQEPTGATTLTIADNGPGLDELPVGPTSLHTTAVAVVPSFGLSLIQTQVAQLQGTVQWTYQYGTQFQLTFIPRTS